MTSLFPILGSIAVLFVALLIFKDAIMKNKLKFCVICVAVSLTWITLLVLFFLKKFTDTTLIALLMGQSILGIYYLLEKRVKEDLKIFRLPFLLSAIVVGYSFFDIAGDIIKIIVFLSLLWIFFIFIYAYRSRPKLNKFVKKIIACCKDW